ncbi:MAG: M23 family metallopeptidase [Mariprofundales bacterium]|nr:M23 family metallopeptidase [Mariprofundales bacterium]
MAGKIVERSVLTMAWRDRIILCAAVVLLLLLQGCYKTDLSAVGYRYGVPVPDIHIVHRGDTLFAIGRRYNISYHRLIRFNHIEPPYTIFVGQRLYLTHAAPKSTSSFIPQKQLHRSSRSKAKQSSAHRQQRSPHVKKRAPRSKRKRAGSAKRAHISRPSRTHASAHHKAVATIPLRWPVKGAVTSRFGSRGSRMHDGIDIGGKLGVPIVAAADGVVVYSDNRLAGYGNLIIIRHRKNLFTAYAHNQVNLVHRGDHVIAGSRIARVGATGRSTGPHLHFEVRRGTTPVDPLLYLPGR